MGRSGLNPAAKAFVPPSFATKQPQVVIFANACLVLVPLPPLPIWLSAGSGLQGEYVIEDAPATGAAEAPASRETYSSRSAARAWQRATSSPSQSPRPSISGDRRTPHGASHLVFARLQIFC